MSAGTTMQIRKVAGQWWQPHPIHRQCNESNQWVYSPLSAILLSVSLLVTLQFQAQTGILRCYFQLFSENPLLQGYNYRHVRCA